MIKHVKAILLFSLLIPVIQAQQVSRFPIKPGSVWRINYEYNCMDVNFSHEGGDEEYKYFIDGDTIIGNRTYFKLIKSGVLFLETPLRIDYKYIGAIRDSADRFYFIEEDKLSENLLYDFSIGLGDSIYYNGYETKIPVDELDSLPDGRKKFIFYIITVHCGSENTIIEGIGWLGGLLEGNSCSSHPGVRGSYLVCYSEDDEVIYETLHTRCGNPIVCNDKISSVNDPVIVQKPELTVLPGKLLKIKMNQNLNTLYVIEVFDMLGRKMILQKSNLNESININHLGNGAYLLKLSNGYKHFSATFVVR